MLWKVPLRPRTNTDATSARARAHTHTTYTHTQCVSPKGSKGIFAPHTPPVFPAHFWARVYSPSQHAASELEVLVTYLKCVRQFPIQSVCDSFLV